MIVMRLQDSSGIDPNYQEIIVFFNARPDAITFSDATLTGAYTLHSVQQNSVDTVVKGSTFANGTFSIPARTTAVFVIEKNKPAPAATESTSTPASTATGNNGLLLTIVGVVIAILAGLGIYLRRKPKA
ncbi:MAG: DUF3372 domain-containing protein [Anaerolineales bacterium]